MLLSHQAIGFVRWAGLRVPSPATCAVLMVRGTVVMADQSNPKELPENFLRRLLLLRSIPRSPESIETPKLLQRVSDEGFHSTPRKVQRDLDLLKDAGLGLKVTPGKPLRWGFEESVVPITLPECDSETAHAFISAEKIIRDARENASESEKGLIEECLLYLSPFFQKARDILGIFSDLQLSDESVHLIALLDEICVADLLDSPIGEGYLVSRADGPWVKIEADVQYSARLRKWLEKLSVDGKIIIQEPKSLFRIDSDEKLKASVREKVRSAKPR